MKNGLILQFAHTATNGRTNFADLQFRKDDTNYFFRDVEAPADWDGQSDWTGDEKHVINAVKGMYLYFENKTEKWYR